MSNYDTILCIIRITNMSKLTAGAELIGRKKELKHLLECLRKGENVAIIAPRRFGKSTLISLAMKQLKAEDHLTACVDLFTTPTADLLSRAIVKDVLKNLKLHKDFQQLGKEGPELKIYGDLKIIMEDFPFISSFARPSRDEWEMLSESLDFPEAFAARMQKRLICAYEEMGILLNVDLEGKMSELFSTKLGQHTHTSYIFSGHHLSGIQKILPGGDHGSDNMRNTIQLAYIDNQVLLDSLKKKFSRLKLKLPRFYINDLVKLTKGHPYYTQLAIRHIILSYVLEGKIPRQKDLPDHLLRLEKHYLEKTWEEISRNREYVQILMALPFGSTNIYPRLKTTKINVARAQKKLEEMGLLLKNEQSGFFIADPLLELWIKKKL